MELINKIRKSRKGFTLVEIIVVLVILAILAAFTIPTMLGFVDDARGKAMMAEAREVYVAAQATGTEISAKGSITYSNLGTALSSTAVLAEQKRVADNAALATPAVLTYSDAQKASGQMATYLIKDISIAGGAGAPEQLAAAKASKTDAYWTVTMDSTNAAKVKSVDYVKNGYQVTITNNDTTVVKF